MADNLPVTPGSGATMGADEVTDGILGTVKVAYGKIMDGTLDSTNKLTVTSGGAAKVDGSAVTQPVSSGTATGAAVPANAFYVGINNTSGNLAGWGALSADGASTIPGVEPTVYNGTNWDRLRSVANATNSAGTGIPAVGNLAQFDDTSPTSITENQFGNLRMSANRNLYQTIRDAAGNERGANVTSGNALVVDGSGSTQPVSASSLPLPTGAATAAKQPALGTAGTASADVITVQGKASMTPVVVDGSGVTQPVSGTVTTSPPSNATVNVNQLAGTGTDTNSGTKSAGTLRVVLATDQPTMTNAQPVTLTSTTITGTVVVDDLAAAATGAAVPSNAQYQGNLAQTALPTAATAGNLTGNMSDKYGRTVVLPGTIRDLVGTQTTTITASTSETTIVTAASSIFNDITTLIVNNTSATAVRVDFRDTTGGTVLFPLYVPAGDVRGFCPPRPLPQTSVNTNWTAQCSASVTDVRIYAVFDKNK